MTRWVRAGNTQKHQKMPGDATKWGEFDLQKSNTSSQKKLKKVKKEFSVNQSNSSTLLSRSPENESLDSSESRKQFSEKRNSNASLKIRKGKKSKLEQFVSEKVNINKDSLGSSSTKVMDDNVCLNKLNVHGSSPEKSADVKNVPIKKDKVKKKFESCLNSQSTSEQIDTSSKVFESKKEMYLRKLQKKRAEKGILLLPPKIERKLYNIKKKLRQKGLPPHILKEVIRKDRRKEELKFRKTFNPSKLCFHCRQPGHMLAECPKKLGSSNQETGMCFKCGSYEHTSFKCPEKVQGFPFAKCFICKEQGHISKDCPKSKHGIYPKGGRCNLCGNVNHLKKDCPSLYKKDTSESTITLHTINEATSIDEEVIEKKEIKKTHSKKAKIVVF